LGDAAKFLDFHVLATVTIALPSTEIMLNAIILEE
jgi:hypothetical protein